MPTPTPPLRRNNPPAALLLLMRRRRHRGTRPAAAGDAALPAARATPRDRRKVSAAVLLPREHQGSPVKTRCRSRYYKPALSRAFKAPGAPILSLLRSVGVGIPCFLLCRLVVAGSFVFRNIVLSRKRKKRDR
ncbi:hypothetical protein MRX96_032000 [Rhipicephalus microplus]